MTDTKNTLVSLQAMLGGYNLPAPAREHPGMTTLEERLALFRLASEHADGRGVIVDAGTFLGASTACFSLGLSKRIGAVPPAEPQLLSFDLAVCDDVVAPIINWHFPNDAPLAAGDSFAPVLQRLLEPYSPWLRLAIGDIRQTLTSLDKQVEIFFLDCAKLASVNEHLMRVVLPRLIPGHSVIVQQDYFHEWLPWLHVSMGVLKDHVAYLGGAGTSAFFLVTHEISTELAEQAAVAWRTASGADGMAMFEGGVPPNPWPSEAWFISLAKASALRWFQGEAAAIAFVDALVPPPVGANTFNFALPPDASVVRGWVSSGGFIPTMSL